MQYWQKFLEWFRLKLSPGPRTFSLDHSSLQSLEALAKRERRPSEELAQNLLTQAIWERQLGEVLDRWYRLTPREKEVTALICLNYTTQQIAEHLLVAPGTVKGYVHHILEKFAVHNRDELRELLAHWDFTRWQ
jgi:DNA-binding CsgD family transcriptional regulator